MSNTKPKAERKESRLVVLLTATQKRMLLQASRESGISLGEIVREALTEYVERRIKAKH